MNFKDSTIKRSFSVLSTKDLVKLMIAMILQFILGLVDVLGISLIALLIALGANNIESSTNSGLTDRVIGFLGLKSLSLTQQVVIIGLVACMILIIKMIAVLVLLQRLNKFMSFRSAAISGDLILRLLSSSLTQLQNRNIQDSLWLLTEGVTILLLQIVARVVAIFGDIALLLIMFVMLAAINVSIALSTVITFGIIGFSLFFMLKKRARIAGEMQWRLSVKSNQEMYEALTSFRETYVRNRQFFFASKIQTTRLGLAQTVATLSFLQSMSKYFLETLVTVAALAVAAIQFTLTDFVTAVTSLGIFLAAASRLAPAVLRLQQNLVELKSASGAALPVLNLIEELKGHEPLGASTDSLDFENPGFDSTIRINGAYFTYPNSNDFALRNVHLEITPNLTYAVVGPSGAGKTTLIDLMLGIITPQTGMVEISGVSPRNALVRWPGAVAYVPQDVVIVNGTIGENISLGFPETSRTRELIGHAVEKSQLLEFLKSLPLGIDSPVGDRGSNLSGGQRQRLGIARALFTLPKVLFLDEATSALDGQTENSLADALLTSGELTVVTIAHRLTTINRAHQIIYVSEGSIVSIGTLDEVRKQVPEFDYQIKLMKGLSTNPL